jgi:hypothetical protein
MLQQRRRAAANALRRQRQLERIQCEKASLAAETLEKAHHLAVVSLQGAMTGYFKAGLEANYKDGAVLWLPSQLTIQGYDNGSLYAGLVMDQIRDLSKKFGEFSVIGFENYRFRERRRKSDGSRVVQGTPGIRIPVVEALRGNNPNIRSSVLLLGDGDISDLPLSPEHNSTAHDVMGIRNIPHLALHRDNELRPFDTGLLAVSLAKQLNLACGGYTNVGEAHPPQ